MATKTVTVDTGEWEYIDSTGRGHWVTNGQTFTFTLTDGGAAAVTYNLDAATSVTTTDGYTLHIRQQVDGKNQTRLIHTFADTEDTTLVDNKRGELVIDCPVTGIPQYWRIAKIEMDNVDAPTLIENATFEDQFGNRMVIPRTGSGITVA